MKTTRRRLSPSFAVIAQLQPQCPSRSESASLDGRSVPITCYPISIMRIALQHALYPAGARVRIALLRVFSLLLSCNNQIHRRAMSRRLRGIVRGLHKNRGERARHKRDEAAPARRSEALDNALDAVRVLSGILGVCADALNVPVLKAVAGLAERIVTVVQVRTLSCTPPPRLGWSADLGSGRRRLCARIRQAARTWRRRYATT